MNPPQNPLVTAVLYGVYMAVSSNIRFDFAAICFRRRLAYVSFSLMLAVLVLCEDPWTHGLRYQLVAGVIEERGIEEFIADRRICNVLSFIVRTSNTFVGSLLWLDFVRFFGLQSSGH